MDEGNKRIAKNTIYLYFRMMVTMALGFVSTRIILDKLGASDYGIYSLVTGFVLMFTVLNSILQSGTTRYIALGLGKNDNDLQKRTFSTSLVLHLGVALAVVLILETFGLWFLNSKFNIDPERMNAANWIFHISVLMIALQIWQTPFSASVIAHEKFAIYSWMSIYDVVAKIAILFILVYLPGDKLIIYAILTFFVSSISLIIYQLYCIKNFDECTNSFRTDKPLLKEMIKFSGWTTCGHIVTAVNSQGTSVILNLFFNTVMNAARGLANTVSFIIGQFISGFMTASQPQLIKFYGAGDMERFEKLIFNVSQYTLFLIAIFAVPIILEIDFVISLWLGGNIPEYTCTFIKITTICTILYKSNMMIDQALVASGNVKQLNLYSTPVYILALPIFYFVLWMGWGPVTAYWTASIPPLIAFVINLYLAKKLLQFPSRRFFINIFLKTCILIVLAMIVPYLIQTTMESNLYRFLVVCFTSVLCTSFVMWRFGLNKETRQMVQAKLFSRFYKSYAK